MLKEMVLDNPLLLKHVRARLRPQHVVPLAGIVALICGAVTWVHAATEASLYSPGPAPMAIFLLLIQGIILLLVGTSRAGAAVSEARDTGMLDFHRISPQRPAALAAGFLLGGPIREYLLFACTLPFALFVVLLGGMDPLAWLAILVAMLSTALLYHATAVIAALTLHEPRGGGVGIVVLIVLLYMLVGPMSMMANLPIGSLTIIPVVTAADPDMRSDLIPSIPPLGQPASALLLTLLHQVPLLLFILIAVARKIRDDLASPFAKPVAVLFYLVIALLTLMDVAVAQAMALSPESNGAAAAAPYALLVAGILLCLAITPARGQFAKAVRHARKRGLPRVPAWDDQGLNWIPLLFLALILLALTLAVPAFADDQRNTPLRILAGAAIAAWALLGFGFAKQALDLAYPKHSPSYFALLLFVLWALPLLVGLLLDIGGGTETLTRYIMAASPLAGIHLALSPPLYYSNASTSAAISLLATALPAIAFFLWCSAIARRASDEAILRS